MSYRCSIIPEEQHAAYFKIILTKQLHLTLGEQGTRSRMENIANGQRIAPHGLSIVCSFDDLADEPEVPMGIAFCEHSENAISPAFLLKDAFRQNSRIKTTLPWTLQHLGFFSVFINPVYRGQGIAKTIMRTMETERVQAITFGHPQDMPFFTALQGSIPLINEHAQFSVACPVNPTSVNFRTWTHHTSYQRHVALSYGDTEGVPLQYTRTMSPTRSCIGIAP